MELLHKCKTVFAISLSLIFFNNNSIEAQAGNTDTAKVGIIQLDDISKLVKDTFNVVIQTEATVKSHCLRNGEDFSTEEWVLIGCLPMLMLLFSLIFIWKFRKSDDFKISKLLAVSDDEKVQSTSRFIALLTGLTAIFVAATLVMYQGYILVAQCDSTMDIDRLWKILAGLGIGIIPYGINVWNGNAKEEQANNRG